VLTRYIDVHELVPRHTLRLGRAGWGQVRLDAAEGVLELLPDLALAHWLCATVYMARQVPKKAFEHVLAGCIAQDKQTPGAAFNAVGLHLLHALLLGAYGRLEEAIEQLEIEIKYVNRSTLIFARECLANCYYTLAAFQWRLGLQDKWRESLAQALIVAPGHVAARAVLHGEVVKTAGPINTAIAEGLVLKRAGRDQDAANLIHAAVRMAPPGSAAWLSALEPWLNAAGRPEAWAELLALIRVRAT
jgi:tetratricopeptide (TPR) repeat protein